MYWVSKVIAPIALVAGVAVTMSLVSTEADGQPPFGKGGFQPPFGKGPGRDDKKAEKKDDKRPDGRKDEKKDERRPDERKPDDRKPDDRKGPGPRPESKPDATVDAWLKVLLEKITDPHDTVRESARGAVIAVGPPAIPALEKLTEGSDAAKAVAARKLIHAIQDKRNPRETQGFQRAGAGPMGPPMGRPGFGLGGEGGRGRGFGSGFGGPGGPDRRPGGPDERRPGDHRPGRPGPGRDAGEMEIAPMPREASE